MIGIPLIVAGLYFFNGNFVSGGSVLFDCRVTTTADINGCDMEYCRVELSGGACPLVCVKPYPVLTLCPIDTPQNEEECKALYEVYQSFVDEPMHYLSYKEQRCDESFKWVYP